MIEKIAVDQKNVLKYAPDGALLRIGRYTFFWWRLALPLPTREDSAGDNLPTTGQLESAGLGLGDFRHSRLCDTLASDLQFHWTTSTADSH